MDSIESREEPFIKNPSHLLKYSNRMYITSFKSEMEGFAILNEQISSLIKLPSRFSNTESAPVICGVSVRENVQPTSLGQSEYFSYKEVYSVEHFPALGHVSVYKQQ